MNHISAMGPVCFGCDERWATLPIICLPDGAIQVRRRIRHKYFAQAFVRTATGISRHYLLPTDDGQALKLSWKIGENVRDKQ